MTGDGSVATPVDLSLSAAQRNVLEPEDPEERLVIISIPREVRPVQRENIVEALVDFQFFDWEAVGRFGRGLEFQVLLEHKADAQTMAEMGHIEIVTERGTFVCSTRLFKEREYKVRVDWLPMSTTLQEVAGLFGDYGRVTRVYKEMAPQYKQFPRYWGGGHLCGMHNTTVRRSCEWDPWLSGCESQGSYIHDLVGHIGYAT